jgi:hypothetical protein
MNPHLTLTILLLSFNCFNILGQDRINREKLNFDTIIGSITKATGWSYNETQGEWIDYDNVISNDKSYKDKYPSLKGPWMMSHNKNNFIKLETKSIKYLDTVYYILLYEKWCGQYKYPSIHEDWGCFKVTYGLIYTESEYNKLSNFENSIDLKTIGYVEMGSAYEGFEESKFLDLIYNELNNYKGRNYGGFLFPIRKTADGIIRFNLPEISSLAKDYNFEKDYFEIDFNSFSKLIIN